MPSRSIPTPSQTVFSISFFSIYSCSIALLLFGIFHTPFCHAQELQPFPPPRICNSYTEVDPTNPWNFVGIRDPEVEEQHCPPSHAYMAAYHAGGLRREAEKIPVWGTCCPVPSDLLSEEHRYVTKNCPKDWIATGAKQVLSPYNPSAHGKMTDYFLNARQQFLRCTKINTERYTLSKRTAGIRVGFPSHFRQYFDSSTSRAAIPPALRYGLGRASQTEWYDSFCLGLPWGSVLVGKSNKYCDGFQFAEVLRKTRSTPARFRLYPECLAVTDYHTPEPKCINAVDSK